MSTKGTIVTAINARVGTTKYSSWRVGLTHDLQERKSYWKNTERQNVDAWTSYQADSLSDAHDIEAHFIHDKGMKGGTGGDLSANKAVYVYIF
jgi:hypothetical protein